MRLGTLLIALSLLCAMSTPVLGDGSKVVVQKASADSCECCGDVNTDGCHIDATDLTVLIDYLFVNHPAIVIGPDCLNVDGHERFTIYDLMTLLRTLFCTIDPWCGTLPTCNPLLPPVEPATNSSVSLSYVDKIMLGATSMYVPLYLLSDTLDIWGYELPLRFTIDGAPPTIDNIVLDDVLNIRISRIENPGGVVIQDLGSHMSPFEGGTSHRIAAIYLSFSSEPYDRTLGVEWLQPPDSVILGRHDSQAVPALFYGDLLTDPGHWAPTLKTFACGDLNGDNNFDIIDLTDLIDYLFINFTPLELPAAANLDGAGNIDISDLTTMIDALFISFTPPGC